MKHFKLPNLSILLLPLLLTGCPSQQSWLASKHPMFAKGYEEGCRSGEAWWQNNLGNYKTVDPVAMKQSPEYQEGWREGFERCRSDKETEIWMQRGSF